MARAWQPAATISNALSGFKNTGIYPFDSVAVPDYIYLTCNLLNDVLSNAGESSTSTSLSTTITSTSINVPGISTSSPANLFAADNEEPASGSSPTNEETPTKFYLRSVQFQPWKRMKLGGKKNMRF